MIGFYEESIDDRVEDGMSEEEAVDSLGNINSIINEILIDTPLPTLIHEKIKKSRKESSHKTLWRIVVICSLPVTIMLLLSFLLIIFSVYITIWGVIVSILASELAMIISGVLAPIAGLCHIVVGNTIPGFIIISSGIISLGLFILTIKPAIALCKQFNSLTVVFLRKMKSFFVTKKEEN